MGNKALSHDSVFLSEPDLENTGGDRLSQENIPGNVKALQLQLKQSIRVGSPPLVIASGKSEDFGTVSEDDGLPRSPPEISTLHEILTSASSKSSNPVQRHGSLSLGGTDSEDEQVSSEASSRPVSPLSSMAVVSSASPASSELPVDFSSPASPLACLDSSAARHRIALNPRKLRSLAGQSKQSPGQEPEENVLSVSVSLDDDNSAIQPLHADQPDESCEDSPMAQVEETNDQEINATTEKADFTKNIDITCNLQNSVSPVIDHALLHEEACPADANNKINEPLSPPYVQCSLTQMQKADCDEENQEVERKEELEQSPNGHKLRQQPTHINIAKLPESLETENEAECQANSEEIAPKLLNTFFEEKEGARFSTAEDALIPLSKSVKQTEEPCDTKMTAEEIEECLPCDNEKTLTTSVPHSSSDALRVQLPSLETSLEMKSTVHKGLDLEVPEASPTTKEVAAAQPQMSEACEEPEGILQTDSDVRGLNLNQLLVMSKISDEPPLAREMHRSLPQGSSEAAFVNVGTDSSSSEQKVIASIPNLNVESSNVVAGSSGEEQLDIPDPQATRSKINKRIEENASSQKSTAKPVRFTITTAWQRSLSGGSSSKEEIQARNLVALAIKPELFEGTGNECGDKERARSEAANGNQEDVHDKSNENTKEIQKSPGAAKPSNFLPADVKPLSKESGVQEEKPPQKMNPEDLPKKPYSSKTAEKVVNVPVAVASSEPAWVSMAKLKQKGFQGHPLAKEQAVEERAVTKSDRETRSSNASENVLRKSLGSDPLRMEKTQPELPVSSTTAATVGQGSPEVNPAPVNEREERQSSSLPVTQNSSAEPPWMSLAKKKHKAWSEMPQIVQ
ncbi:acrosomal protein KIAA1210 homolog isoform X2 [Rhinatrema bivittatum]|uniref:acrosomal protein KIAA1210 homolog isoform X2 n=1 Tax=Rhinatrema bivittatum TaxID=194408 RepID=UPI0011290E63|nr:acrosomal protein KIAA1210 homolog isoform X2 [Rhinatrema bivittatum]